MNEVSTVMVFIIFVLFFTIIISIINDHSELFLEYRVASHNNKTYGIQEEFNESHKALELLAKLHEEMDKFVNELSKIYPNDERISIIKTLFLSKLFA
jgi:hypothetical protein